MTFDAAGNMCLGNFADGLIHKIAFGPDGTPVVFAKVPFMRSCDGIFYDKKTDKIYVADSLANAVQVVDLEGNVTTLAADTDNNGASGHLDQPCEVLVRDGEVIVSNFGFPIPTGVNRTFDKPHTMSIIRLPDGR